MSKKIIFDTITKKGGEIMKNDDWKLHLLKLLSSIPADATKIHRFLLQKTTMSRKEAWNVAQAFEIEVIANRKSKREAVRK